MIPKSRSFAKLTPWRRQSMNSWPVYQSSTSGKRDFTSVTSKKSPNVYESCPKRISLLKWKILTPLQKLPTMCWWFGQNNYCPGLWKVAQSIKKSPNLVTLLVPQIYCNKDKSSYHHRVLLQKVTSELKSNTLIQSDFIVNDIFWEIDDYCLKR